MTNADPARSQRYLENNQHSLDSNKKSTLNQYILLVQSHQLTEVADRLESAGITDDLTVSFVIANLQRPEVAA